MTHKRNTHPLSWIYVIWVVCLTVITLPVQLFVALVSLCAQGWPVIFPQVRIGFLGKPFVIYKFRTMRRDAESSKEKYTRLNEATGPVFKIRNDPRFTTFGKFLSHTGLDELPQLWNVLRGEMALIGPRPLPINEGKKLENWMRIRESVLPGIISPAILAGKYHEDFGEWMKSDVAYVKTKNPVSDIMLVGRSVAFLIRLCVGELNHALHGR